jgi:hypothetical protein
VSSEEKLFVLDNVCSGTESIAVAATAAGGYFLLAPEVTEPKDSTRVILEYLELLQTAKKDAVTCLTREVL